MARMEARKTIKNFGFKPSPNKPNQTKENNNKTFRYGMSQMIA
jgi:hypothetical protein